METHSTFDSLSVIKSQLTYIYMFPSFGGSVLRKLMEVLLIRGKGRQLWSIPSFHPFYHYSICN